MFFSFPTLFRLIDTTLEIVTILTTLKENVGNSYNVFVEQDEGNTELIGDESAETLNSLIGLTGTVSTAMHPVCSISCFRRDD